MGYDQYPEKDLRRVVLSGIDVDGMPVGLMARLNAARAWMKRYSGKDDRVNKWVWKKLESDCF